MEPSTTSSAPTPASTHSIATNSLDAVSPSAALPSSPTLPLELLSHILFLATTNRSPLERQTARFAFSRVAKQWNAAAQLDASEGEPVVVNGSQRAVHLKNALDLEKKAKGKAQRTVTRLVLMDEGPPATRRGPKFASLVKKLPDLVSLNITARMGTRATDSSLGMPLSQAIARMSKLRHFGLEAFPSGAITVNEIQLLMQGCQRLESFCAQHTLLNGDSGRAIHLPKSIKHLSCPLEIASLFIFTPGHSVQSLRFEGYFMTRDAPRQLFTILPLISTTLVTLFIPPSFYSLPDPTITPLNKSLEALVVVQRLSIHLSLLDTSTIFTSLLRLPKLEHLILSGRLGFEPYAGAHPTSQDVVKFLKNAPSLKRLALPQLTLESWSEEERANLREVAMEVGVVLVEMKDYVRGTYGREHIEDGFEEGW